MSNEQTVGLDKYMPGLAREYLRNGGVLCYHQQWCKASHWAGDCDCRENYPSEDEQVKRVAIDQWMTAYAMQHWRCLYRSGHGHRCVWPNWHKGKHGGVDGTFEWLEGVSADDA